MRAELAESLVQVFIERGFDAVTVEQAASSVGISRATFFRYFSSKEDVVVVAVESAVPDQRSALSALPPDAGSPWELARAALEPTIRDAVVNPRRKRERLRLIASRPSLRARFAERRQGLVAALEEVLAERMTSADAAVVAAAATAALDVAWHRWARSDDADFAHEVDAVFRVLDPRMVSVRP